MDAKALETLRDEHRVIEHGLLVLEAMANRLEQGEAVPRERVASLLEFFRSFADGCHHAKEEETLFPELEGRGIPREGGPIGVMLHEHEEGRALQQRMRRASSNLAEEADRQEFITAAREYIALLRRHISKEDDVLFPMAQQVLTEADDEALLERFERHEREQLGEGVHERYHQLIHELEAEFGE